jgi:NAD(P)-dependent dehydrogenase (short-subunit alcohol dehydrogenase family)
MFDGLRCRNAVDRASNEELIMSKRLAQKVCLITGTGGSIGREAALRFAREGALIVGSGFGGSDAEATVAAVRASRCNRVT